MTRPRAALLVAGAITLGLLSRKVPLGISVWDKSLGDVLYAVMIFGIVTLVVPNLRATVRGTLALVICLGIELFQLSGIPKTLPRILRAAIGDTFAWHDVVCYAVGALVATAVVRAIEKR